MDNQANKGTYVDNNGIKLPEHDYKGLADVVQNAKPTFPKTDNGFMPISEFDPKKTYEDWKEFILRHVQYVENGKLTLEQFVTKLQDCFDKRTADWKTHYDALITELRTHHDALVTVLKDKHEILLDAKKTESEELKKKNEALKTENKKLRDEKISDLEKYHAEAERYRDEINRLTREVADAKLERLAIERDHLDVDRSQLRNDQNTLFAEKQDWLKSIVDKVKDFKIAKLFK